MKTYKQKVIIVAIFFVAAIFIASFILVQIKDRTYFHSPPYSPKQDKDSTALVVYYSRSGNTEAMAREIAQRLQADIIKLETKLYSLDFKGWFKANRDSRSKKNVDIRPEVVDLQRYRLVFLGSPIWWYRPAPPLWTFVEKNDFSGKEVVLFNTFYSLLLAVSSQWWSDR